MRLGYLTTLGLPVFFLLSACSSSSTTDGSDDGTGGVLAQGGIAGSTAGSPGSGGSLSGTSGSGAAGSGNASFGGVSGSGAGGSGNSSGAAVGGAGSPSTAGSGVGGAAAGMPGTGGSPGGAGGTGGATAGAGGSGGTAGTPPTPSMSGLPTPPGNANVPKPSGTPGDITPVSWAGFKAAVTYSFDDNTGTQLQYFDRLMALDVPFTFFLWTGQSSANDAKWTTALMKGHEIANHTQSHQSNGTAQDIDAATNFIKQKFNITPYTMAAPNGAAVYTNLAKGKFIINRGVSNSVIMPGGNSDPFTLPTFIANTGAGAGAFNTEVDKARSMGGWQTVCIHGFQGGVSDGAYNPISLAGFEEHVNRVKGFGDVWIGTMSQVGAYWLGEKAFKSATTMTSGTDKTWTWTLPENFPPKQYLRVKVAGGTLKQGGTPLAWDPHGYYEISLDAKSVTLSP